MYLILSPTSLNLRRCCHRLAVSASLPLLLVLVSTSASMAQEYGRGPSVNNLNYEPRESSYSLDQGVTCPTPTFSVAGFYGQATDTAYARNTNVSANSGVDNYGVAATFTIPLGGRLSEYCTDYATLITENVRKTLEINTLTFQSELVQQCIYLYGLGVRFEDWVKTDEEGKTETIHVTAPEFAEGGALYPCRSIVKSVSTPTPVSVSTPTPPKISAPEPLTPPALPVYVVPR